MSIAKARHLSDPRLRNLAILRLSAQHAKLCVASPPLLHIAMREEPPIQKNRGAERGVVKIGEV
jgi:hypothetical protein